MRSSIFGFCLSALAFGALVCAANMTLAQTQDSALNSGEDILLKRQQTETHLRQGRLLFKQQRIEEALAEYTKAFDLMRTYDIALELGKAEARLGWHALAATHLRYAILHLPLSAMPKERDALNKEFESSRAQVGGLSLRVSQAGAEIFVDGKVLGVSPLADDVFVMPGEHGVEAKLAGFEASTKRVNVGAGGTEVVEMNLAAVQAPKGTGDLKGETPKVVEVKKNLLPVVVLGATALAGFATSIAFEVTGQNHVAHAEELVRTIGDANGNCEGGAQRHPQCDDYLSTRALVKTHGWLSLTFGAVGVLSTAGAFAYWYWPRKAVPATSKTGVVGVAPVFARGVGGGVVKVVF